MADKLRFQKIDETTIGLHSYLEAGDTCFYLREYTSRQGFGFSATNQLVHNLKKKRGSGGYATYKPRAIRQCGDELFAGLNPRWLRTATLVPIPPSKVSTDVLYDDRMLQVCRRIASLSDFNVDVREIVKQIASSAASHEGEDRPTVNEIVANYRIDETVAAPDPVAIGVIDDVLTSGTHFKAMQRVLQARYPATPIVGLFVTRRVFADDETDWFEDLDA